MRLQFVHSSLFVLLAVAATASAQAVPSEGRLPGSGIAGVWVLNPALTQRPSEIGFDRDLAQTERGGEGTPRSRRGRGSGGSGGESAAPMTSRESADDATRVDQLTGEARTPPAHLAIVQKPDTVSIADDQGHSRTFHPNGKQEDLTLGTVPLPTTARWDGGSLVIVYDVESGWQLRYTYTASANPARLLVDIRFLERGREGDEVRLTYEPEGAQPTQPAALPAQPSAPVGAPAPAAAGAIGAPPAARPKVLPPGSELRGINTIGTEIDDLTTEGVACGLDRDKIKGSIARVLADAGFKAQPAGGDEESYVLLTVMTSKLPNGMCVSRYDASLVAQADATFPYLNGLVNVPVQLLHDGGMVGGSAASHPSAVLDALTKSVNGFISQIRAANK